ncbi:hypothetical protein LTR62_004676 [Meristemomyces frigidus]|uniref:Uncharacterized protein n=1 Tax=Meristemomyces frigidus TaxID=1508187 RepID=A0AAN7TE81_9PEZI|nr:hypothetical protein LTR62_004676 [Meristemomyces frigidus]
MPAIPSLSPSGALALGIIVGLLSTCIQSLGLTLQRKSHILEDTKHHSNSSASPPRPAYKRRRWQLGMLLFLVANVVGSSIQITTLPLPLLSTLQASGLVFNSILASLLLKEAFTWRTGYGTVLVAGGAGIISAFSALPERSHTLDQLIALLGYRSFLLWFTLSLVFCLGLLAVDFTIRNVVERRRRKDGRGESSRLLLVRGMSYGAVSGILSAHGLLLAKSAVELLVRSFADKDNQFRNYRSWLLILSFLILALSQLYYLHLGLRLISTSVLYPFVFCVYNIVAILDGLIYFRQMDRLPPLHAGLIALGTVVLLAGVLALSWRIDAEAKVGDTRHRPSMAQHDVPQTLLTPGLGFVGDPEEEEDSETNESAIADDEEAGDASRDEREPLLTRTRKRSNTAKSESHGRTKSTSKRRKRASTLKEVIHIWEDEGDEGEEDEEAYGTFGSLHHHNHSDPLIHSANGHSRQQHRPMSADAAPQPDTTVPQEDTELEPGHPSRAQTLPASRQSRSRRRTSTHGDNVAAGHANAADRSGGALFREMLDLDWWRSGPGSGRSRRRSDVR